LIDYAASQGVARLTLHRPEKRNALSPELMTLLGAALDRAAADESVRVILLRGAGPDFCAGLDLAELQEDGGAMGHLADAERIAGLYRAVRRNPRPVVAAVHGRAFGGGCGLATACDLILASESAEFRYPEVNLGFVAAIVAALLRRSVGEKQAFELVATAGPLSAAEACRLGMVNHVYPDASFDANVEEYLKKLSEKSASALALIKSLLYHIDGMSLDTAIQSGAFVNALARSTEDARRGIQGFLHKRK
jgi:methylglutaconyl-CoA hydratase